ncbi:hypothetical protein QUG02_04965 [Bacillus hominis]|uniref:Uncharacterized protein n=1 Tax=Bacillus hominis TaxID=2817478 RepID=A0ABT7R3J7_9BACI|nr:hypothetical protein [Bacillus hominis]MDM5192329.1 hypothetical protein [Bacillus hominis]MDM5432057.1 hypothetical protein [Bacillus hominis]MDM5437493.1 hypothetical protein [Bacillus hominis]
MKTRDIKKDLKTFCEILCLLFKESDFQIVSTIHKHRLRLLVEGECRQLNAEEVAEVLRNPDTLDETQLCVAITWVILLANDLLESMDNEHVHFSKLTSIYSVLKDQKHMVCM